MLYLPSCASSPSLSSGTVSTTTSDAEESPLSLSLIGQWFKIVQHDFHVPGRVKACFSHQKAQSLAAPRLHQNFLTHLRWNHPTEHRIYLVKKSLGSSQVATSSQGYKGMKQTFLRERVRLLPEWQTGWFVVETTQPLLVEESATFKRSASAGSFGRKRHIHLKEETGCCDWGDNARNQKKGSGRNLRRSTLNALLQVSGATRRAAWNEKSLDGFSALDHKVRHCGLPEISWKALLW